MKFKISAEMVYAIQAESSILFNIHALKSPKQKVLEESFLVDPFIETNELHSVSIENRFVQIIVSKPCTLTVRYQAIIENSISQNPVENDNEILIGELDGSIHPYLFPSRYCQSDKLPRFAQHTFGHIKGAFAKVSAITNWIFQNVQYIGGFTTSQTSAYDTVAELVGVCRDFAHLGIALCRALSIPARYFTAYALNLKPGDFHACFEAFIDNSWIIFDPTYLVPLNGMVKIATGRDAADTSIATMYGEVNFISMNVECLIFESEFSALPAGLIPGQLISYS